MNGWILINYSDGTGHVAVFSVNGKMLAAKELDDQIIVSSVGLCCALFGVGEHFLFPPTFRISLFLSSSLVDL